MNIRSLDLNLLVVFDALMREQSVTRAAARLFLTQPAVSHALERLRTALSDPLFVRGKGAMVPTPRALRIDAAVRPLLQGLSSALTDAPFSPATLDQTFRIGTPDIGGFVVMPHLVPAFEREAPLARIAISDFEADRFQAQLAGGTLDVVIAPKSKLGPGMHERLLLRQAHVVGLVRRDHPAARRKLSLAVFHRLRRVAVTVRGGTLASPIEAALASGSAPPADFAVSSQHFIAAAASLLGSDMMLISGDVVARKLVAHFPLRIVKLPIDLPPIDTMVIWHERAHHDPAQRWFRERIFEAAAAIALGHVSHAPNA